MRPSNMGIHSVATASAEQAVQSQAEASDAESSAPPSQLRRLNEEGAAVPGSQDTVLAAQAQQQLRISESHSEQPASLRRRRPRQEATSGASVILRCAMCGPSPGAFQPADSRGLLQHLCRTHLGQELTAEAIAQLRNLGKVACRICGGIRARTSPACSRCGCATATRPLRLGDRIPDTRRGAVAGSEGVDSGPSHPRPLSSNDGLHPPAAPAESGDEWETRRAAVTRRTCDLLNGISRNTLQHFPAAIASRYAVAWAESLEGMMAGDVAWKLSEAQSQIDIGFGARGR